MPVCRITHLSCKNCGWHGDRGIGGCIRCGNEMQCPVCKSECVEVGAITRNPVVFSILISVVLASAAGVGWVVGCGIAGGLAGYGIAKMIKSGGKQDQIRQEMIKSLQKRLDTLQSNDAKQCNLGDLKSALSDALKNNLISGEQAERLVKLVADGKLNARVAQERLHAINGTCAVAARK